MASGKGFSLSKIWKTLESIDYAKDKWVDNELRRMGFSGNARKFIRAGTGGIGSLNRAITEREENGNQGTKQVQGRTSKYKGHYHTVYGGGNDGTSVPGVAGGSYERRWDTRKRYQKRYK